MEENNFYANWLNDRYPFDSEARNKDLEAAFLSYLNQKEEVRLVDVGAGTGSNALYLMDKISGNQHWHFIEQDASFEEVVFHRLEEYASYHKYDWIKKGHSAFITTPNKQLTFQFINGSLLDIKDLVELETIDIVVANAVFDLFSKDQIQQFLQPILAREIACYFTLNYQSMSFHPEDPFDDTFISLYETHMERPQTMGSAMGKKANSFIQEQLSSSSKVTSGISTWHFQQEDIKMHYYLLNFMESAIPELDMKEEIKVLLPKWIQRKKDQIISRQLELQIHHLDIFSIPHHNE